MALLDRDPQAGPTLALFVGERQSVRCRSSVQRRSARIALALEAAQIVFGLADHHCLGSAFGFAERFDRRLRPLPRRRMGLPSLARLALRVHSVQRPIRRGDEVDLAHKARRDGGIGVPFKLDARRGKPVRELHEPVHRGQVGDVVGDDERLDDLARCQRRGVARIVVSIAVGLVHLPDLAVADEVGAALCRFDVGGGEDELGARERREVDRALLAIGFGELVERVHAEDERPAEPAAGLQAVLDRG